MSLSLPLVAQTLKAMPRRSASTRQWAPSAPDWLASPMDPGLGGACPTAPLNVAISLLRVLITPRQFGPSTRTPLARARAVNSACTLTPSAPISAKPEV
ncbi:Uncharacterised protein [Bordetella pertussis]|nr:Uncharacterised protein [Bordetella pertussis]